MSIFEIASNGSSTTLASIRGIASSVLRVSTMCFCVIEERLGAGCSSGTVNVWSLRTRVRTLDGSAVSRFVYSTLETLSLLVSSLVISFFRTPRVQSLTGTKTCDRVAVQAADGEMRHRNFE
ncbi:hypothetical protein HN011_002938 [Eciton burchellii]|nr:hypothetical protein HN011_002938 [Eciton burchellii]